MTKSTIQSENTRNSTTLTILTILTIWLLLPGKVMAMAVPAAGSFAYDLYDIGVNQILLGPIGFIAGVACMVFAAILAIRQMILPAAGVVLGGAFLLKADSVVQTIGALIG
jgi:nitrate reductase gamma subunit